MLTSDKETRLNTAWQIRTRDGMHYQPESLNVFYQWIIENRLTASDFSFNVKNDNWIPLANVPELRNCFWQLLTSENIVYGPLSLGEIKQLFSNGQIGINDKVTIHGKENWAQIKDLPSLNEWLESREALVADYVKFINRLLDELQSGRNAVKEEKIGKRLKLLERESKENLSRISELENIKEKLETELVEKKEELEDLTRKVNEAGTLKIELQEKAILIEELNKNIAQSEVTSTLKDSETAQLRSRIINLDEELENVKSEKSQLQHLNEDIDIKERELAEVRESLSNSEEEVERYKQEIIKLQNELLNRDRIADEIKHQNGDIESLVRLKEEEMANLQNILSEKESQILGYKDSMLRLEGELASKDRQLANGEGIKDETERLAAEINIYKLKIDELENGKSDLVNKIDEALHKTEQDLSIKENIINDLKNKLEGIESEYTQRISRLNEIFKEKELAVDKLNSEKHNLNAEILNLKQDYEKDIERVSNEFGKEIALKEDTINRLKAALDDIQIGYVKKIDELSAILNEKESVLIQINTEKENLNTRLTDLKNELNKSLGDVNSKELTINGLNVNLYNLQEEYKNKIKGWETVFSNQKAQFQNEIEHRAKIWDETFRQEKENWDRKGQDLEGSLAQRDAEIDGQKLEIARLQDAVITADKQWKERLSIIKDESRKLYEELEKQKDDLKYELTEKISELAGERDIARASFVDLEKAYNEVLERQNTFQKELLNKDNFISIIKNEAERKEETYKSQLVDLEEKLERSNEEIAILRDRSAEFARQLQNELDIQEGLKKNISVLNEELNNLRKEKDNSSLELIRNKEEFNQLKIILEHDFNETKRSLEHAEEENRTLQKQFYIEKQKLTKEYTETVNKLEKLQKKTQLEREIQDRTKMKEDMERLYNLLRENFDGIQRGAQEIQTSIQAVTEDIDNRRLSLKYITESEKRDGKKGLNSRTEPSSESEISS